MEMPRPYDLLADTVDTPMYVATTEAHGERAGCLVGFSVQCSIDPLHHLVCLSKANRTFEVARRAEWIALHVLRAGDGELASLFGEETGKEVDKFARCRWSAGPGGVPVLDGCDWFAGRIVERVDLGDHAGFVIAVGRDGVADRNDEPRLGFQDVYELTAGNDA